MLLDHTSGLPDYFLNAEHRPPAPAGQGRGLDGRADVGVRACQAGRAPAGPGPTPTPTTCSSASSSGPSPATRSRRRCGAACSTRWGSRTRGTRREEKPRAKGTVAYRLVAASGGGVRVGPGRPPRATSCRSGRSSRPLAAPGPSPRPRRTRHAGCRPSRAARCWAAAMQREMLADVAPDGGAEGARSRTGWASRRCRSLGATPSATRAGSWASGTWCATCRGRA